MEFWTGSQRQLPLYSKYGTVPGQNLLCQEKQHSQDFHQPLYERDVSHERNWWTVPGSRAGWVLRDHTKQTGRQLPDFPFTLDSQPRSLGFSRQLERERAERQWAQAEMERAHKEQESERKVQKEGWGRRWEPCSPIRYRRDCKRSMSDSSKHELEAWASRYCHSLPRKRRMEAGMWGVQGFQRGQMLEKERFPQLVGRDNADFQVKYPPTQNPPTRGRRQGEESHPAIPFRPPQSPLLQRAWEQGCKENEFSYQQRVSNQPPSYNPPPPYSAPHYSRSVTQQPQKYSMKNHVRYIERILAQQHAQKGNYGMLAASVKQEVQGDVITRQQGEEAWIEEWNNRKQLDLHRRQGQGDKSRYGSLPPPKPMLDNTTQSPCQGQPEIKPQFEEQTLSEASKSVKAKLKKKRGRETIFCLVSRLGGVAGLSSSPEDPLQSISLPLFGVPNLTGTVGSGTEVLRSGGSGEGSMGFQLSDEIDSKVTDHHKFSSHSRAPPLWTPVHNTGSSSRPLPVQIRTGNEQEATHREEEFWAIQTRTRYQTRRTNCQSGNAEDTKVSKTESPQASAAPEIRKQQPHGSVKFPLWKEPSLVTQMNTNPALQCAEGSWEKQGGAAEDLSHEKDALSNALCGYAIEESMLKHKEDTISDGSSGIFVIDATCVIVRAEFITPPKKELVQYPSEVLSLNPRPLENAEIINNQPTVTSEQELDMLPQDSPLQKSGEKMEGRLGKQEFQTQEPDSETEVSHIIGDIGAQGANELPNSSLPDPIIPANETLEERAVRILGIPLLGSSVEETKSKEQPQDFVVHNTNERQQSSSDLPSMEHESEATPERQDEDENYLQDCDTAEDNQLMDGDNTLGMETEEICSQVEEPKCTQPSVHELSKEDVADICNEIQGIIKEGTISEDRASSYPQVEQDTSKHAESIVHHLLLPSENLCLTPTNCDTPSQSPPKSPSQMPPLNFPLPLLGSPNNDQLQVPSPLSHTASCCSLSRSASSTCSPSRAHSPLCSMYPSSHPLDSTSLTHFPSSSSPPFDSISNSELQSPETPADTLTTPQSLTSLQREEPQYPKSLWDAVYRIRRHTAPDSENEEEEGGELWDNPENVIEGGETKKVPSDLVCMREMDRSTVETASQSKEVLEEDSIDNSARHRDQLVENKAGEESRKPDTTLLREKVGLREERQSEEELGGQVDDDTLSCSSSDSHASRDTVIMGKEEEEDNRTGVEIAEGVEDSKIRVGTEAKQINQILLSSMDEMSSEELPELPEDTGSYGEISALTVLCPTKECFRDGDEIAVVGETDNKLTVETSPRRDEDGELISEISCEDETRDSVCLGALTHSNLKEGKHTCVLEETVKSIECCSDTKKTKGNQDSGLVAGNKGMNEVVRYEKILMETNTSSTPEQEEADMEEENSEQTCNSPECHDAEYAITEEGTAPEPGLTCDSFVTGMTQQGEQLTDITGQQDTDIWPPEEEVNHSIQDILQVLQEAATMLFEEK